MIIIVCRIYSLISMLYIDHYGFTTFANTFIITCKYVYMYFRYENCRKGSERSDGR